MHVFEGEVRKIRFSDLNKGFYIFELGVREEGKNFLTVHTVKGSVMGSLQVGEKIKIQAQWVQDKKWGKQLKIVKAPYLSDQVEEWTWMDFYRMAKPGLVREFFSFMDKEVYSCWYRVNGSDLPELFPFEVKEEGCGELLDLFKNKTGLEATEEDVAREFAAIQAHHISLNFLQDLGIKDHLIKKIWNVFDNLAEEVLSRNPWRLLEIDGFDLKDVDQIAVKLGLDFQSQDRKSGLVCYQLKKVKSKGHLFISESDLLNSLGEHFTTDEFETALVENETRGVLVRDQVNGEDLIYERWLYEAESQSAKILLSRSQTAQVSPDFLRGLKSVGPDTKKAIEDGNTLEKCVEVAVVEWMQFAKSTLSANQQLAVVNALTQPVSILTGLPGSGKTFTLRAVVQILQEANENFLLIAPTGIAAKRMKHVTHVDSYTVHKAFGSKPEDKTQRAETYFGVVESGQLYIKTGEDEDWEHSPDNPHAAKFIIVDESSMVSMNLLYRILQSTSPDCRILFVGDSNQLPSVGPGNVLRDMIDSDLFPSVCLQQIYRQANTSGIVFAARDIIQGKQPTPCTDFNLLTANTEKQILSSLLQVVTHLHQRGLEFQVLSPRHLTDIGVTNLNKEIRSLINPAGPGKQEIKIGGEYLREGDRVMSVKNNYSIGVCNGDVGVVHKIDRKRNVILVALRGPVLEFKEFPLKEARTHLRLAFCVTIHKSQGLSFEHVIMPIFRTFGIQLQRNLLYTAVTRAEKKVFLLGTQAALQKSVFNDKEALRRTHLLNRLLNDGSC